MLYCACMVDGLPEALLSCLKLELRVNRSCEITADNNYSYILSSSSDIPLLREELIGFE